MLRTLSIVASFPIRAFALLALFLHNLHESSIAPCSALSQSPPHSQSGLSHSLLSSCIICMKARLLRAPHFRNRRLIPNPGFRPPCSCRLARAMSAQSCRQARRLSSRCPGLSFHKAEVKVNSSFNTVDRATGCILPYLVFPCIFRIFSVLRQPDHIGIQLCHIQIVIIPVS